ncbi:MAG: DUF4468 domain-containing protein [Desulfocucumaceae bacterium]
MKKTIFLFISMVISVMVSNAQTNFKWDIADSIPKSKSQIYSDTKIFIAKTWKSAQTVIQNDDKEAGNILVKGSSVQKVYHSMNDFTYVYSYTVTFRMKDNKFKIIIDNVFCESAVPVGQAKYDILKIEPFDGEYVKGKTGMMTATLPEKKAVPMMATLRAELQSIVDNYIKYINETSSTEDDW